MSAWLTRISYRKITLHPKTSSVMPDKQFCVVGLGEILWDILPSGKQLGGAPANFAYCASLLGDKGIAASRLGNDELGKEALQKFAGLGLETSRIQMDATHPTGTVHVNVDLRGEPTFEITQSVAWDYLAWEPGWQTLAIKADAVCFGSLAQRSQQSRETIRAFVNAVRPGTARVLDVNLRQSFFSAEILSESMRIADIVKLNQEELPRVAKILGIPETGTVEACAKQFLEAYGLTLVCVTRGAQGSILASRNGTSEHDGFRVPVIDTVGAGDAFTAALVYHFLRGSSLEKMNEAANRMGSWVASNAGATPLPQQDVLDRVRIATRD
jgi:fructokinase